MSRQKDGVYGMGIGLGQDEDISMFLQTLIWSYGGSVFDTSGKQVVLNSPQVVSAIEYMLDLYRAGAIPPGAIAWDNASNNNLFLARKLGMTANTLSIDYVAKRRDPQLYNSIIHTAYPAGPAGSFSYVQCFGWCVNKNTKHREAIARFLRDLYTSSEHEHLFAMSEGAIAPLSRAIGNKQTWQAGRYADARVSVEVARPLGWPGPFSRFAAEVYNRRILNNIFDKVINKGQSPSVAVANAAKEVSDILK
jgi:multiple sugar transport system substrate-binding protein